MCSNLDTVPARFSTWFLSLIRRLIRFRTADRKQLLSTRFVYDFCLLLYMANAVVCRMFTWVSENCNVQEMIRVLLIILTVFIRCRSHEFNDVDCTKLRMGQYLCPDPSYDYIDIKTQQPRGCMRETNRAKVMCRAAPGIVCRDTKNSTFFKEIPCKWTNGYSFETALLLSIFLGMFGADRFYLGYPAIGLLKFCTLGFMFLGQLVDIILIATQTVGPADGSYYVIPHYGAGIEVIRSNNWTYKLPQDDWWNSDLFVSYLLNINKWEKVLSGRKIQKHCLPLLHYYDSSDILEHCTWCKVTYIE